MENLFDILRQYPAVALFLTVGVGFMAGRIRYKSFSLGSVTAVLLTGVLVGQLDIRMPGPLKTVFFMMFLFSIGYSVGPQFFRSLRGSGLKQVAFAFIMSSCCFGATLGVACVLKYSVGETVGLFSGSQTCSALMGVGSEAISRMPLAESVKARELSIIPVCYAVTYIFGTLGTVVILGNLGPKLLGGLDKVRRQTRELEESMDHQQWDSDPAVVNALRNVSYRAYRVENYFFMSPRSVAESEVFFRQDGIPVFIERIRRNGIVKNALPDSEICYGDEIAVSGQRDFMVRGDSVIGAEVADEELLSFPVEKVPVLVTDREVCGRTLESVSADRCLHGVGVERLCRRGKTIGISPDLELCHGDVLTLVGSAAEIHRAAARLGHMDRPTDSSDLMFVGIAIFIGGLIGALTFFIGDIPVSFGTSGGALIAGLVLGWWRSRRPTFGNIPRPALWLMNNLGLNVFVAVIGIESGTSFVAGLQSVGWLLLVAGVVATSVPLLVGLWLGHKVFKFHPAITLGCCAGTRTCTASLGAVQDVLGSSTPAIGYTVTYAVSNVLLVIWGMLTVILVGQM